MKTKIIAFLLIIFLVAFSFYLTMYNLSTTQLSYINEIEAEINS